MAYSNISLVSAYLGGVTIDDSSAVTSTEVSDWLDWADAEIDKITGSKYVTGTVSNELYTYAGGNFLRLNKRPVISITSLEYNDVALGNGDANWVALSEGRDSSDDFIFTDYSGEILFHGTRPYTDPQGVRASYTYGYATTPDLVIELATAIVAKKWLRAVLQKDVNDSPSNISVGSISITKNTSSADLLIKTNTRIGELKNLVGVMDVRMML